MMGKPRFKATQADAEDGTMGICVDCGEFASGVEPDARGYICECCGHKSVYGVEEAVIEGLVDLESDDDDDDDSIDDNGDGDDADPADDGSGIVVDPHAAD